MIIAKTTFSQAVGAFQSFLADNNLPTEILWIFKEDTFCRNTEIYETKFWLKVPVSKVNTTLAEKQYKIGQQNGLGICLSAIALCEDKICCHLVIPRDKEDSDSLMMSPEYLKFSFVNEMPKAKVVTNDLKWTFMTFFSYKFKQGNFLVYLQSKKDLQFSGI